MTQLEFMGSVLSQNGIGPTEEKVEAVANAREAENISEVKSFRDLLIKMCDSSRTLLLSQNHCVDSRKVTHHLSGCGSIRFNQHINITYTISSFATSIFFKCKSCRFHLKMLLKSFSDSTILREDTFEIISRFYGSSASTTLISSVRSGVTLLAGALIEFYCSLLRCVR